MALHVEQRHRRDGRADHAGEGVERKHLAEPFRRRVMRQQRIVGRVKHGVAEAGDAVHRDEHPVRIDDAGDRIGDAADSASPAISTTRAPMRSTRKPTGVCNTPETTLNTVSASASSV